VGDAVSSPTLHFNLLGEIPEADYVEVCPHSAIDTFKFYDTDFVVVGGGGVFMWPKAMKKLHDSVDPERLCLWGIGLNTHNKEMITHDSYPSWVTALPLAGVRDVIPLIRYVPCASCIGVKKALNAIRPKPVDGDDYVVYDHKDVTIRIDGKHRNNDGDASCFNEVLEFLSSASVVITNSYHGAYWASLLGRKVVVVNAFSSRFYRSGLNWIMTNLREYKNAISQSWVTDGALDRCVLANECFHFDVVQAMRRLSK
jgi:hypothetical protein